MLSLLQILQHTFKSIMYDKMDTSKNQKVGVVKFEKDSEVLFEGVDPELFKETKYISEDLNNEFSNIKEDFCFLFVGHWLQGNLGEDRKDVGMMIKVFLEAFKPKRLSGIDSKNINS